MKNEEEKLFSNQGSNVTFSAVSPKLEVFEKMLAMDSRRDKQIPLLDSPLLPPPKDFKNTEIPVDRQGSPHSNPLERLIGRPVNTEVAFAQNGEYSPAFRNSQPPFDLELSNPFMGLGINRSNSMERKETKKWVPQLVTSVLEQSDESRQLEVSFFCSSWLEF